MGYALHLSVFILDSKRIKKDKRANNILKNQDILLKNRNFLDDDKIYLLSRCFNR